MVNTIRGAFEYAVLAAENARTRIDRTVYHPNRISRGGRRDILRFLSAVFVPQTHPQFRNVVDGLAGAIAQVDFVTMAEPAQREITGITSEPEYTAIATIKISQRVAFTDANGLPRWFYRVNVVQPPEDTEDRARLCSTGNVRAITEVLADGGRYMILCPVLFDLSAQVNFPLTANDRLADCSRLAFSHNHIDTYFLHLVGTLIHEMHHALVPQSRDVQLNTPVITDHGNGNVERLDVAYSYEGLRELRREVVTQGRDERTVFWNAEGNVAIAIAEWMNGNSWDTSYAIR